MNEHFALFIYSKETTRKENLKSRNAIFKCLSFNKTKTNFINKYRKCN